MELTAHLEPIVDPERRQVGFCVHSQELAELFITAVHKENVDAAVAMAHPGLTQEDACDIVLPCHPDASDSDIKHAVLAATKASHVFFCAQAPRAA